MPNILLVGLLQAVLCQNIQNARPYVRTNIDSGRQFYLRAPEGRKMEAWSQHAENSGADLNNYRSYSVQNVDNLYRQEEPKHQPLNDERSFIQNNEYYLATEREIDHDRTEAYIPDEPHLKISNSGRRFHRININGMKSQSRVSDERDTLNTNLNPQSNVRGGSFAASRTKYNTNNDDYPHTGRDQTQTNKQSSINPEIASIPISGLSLKTNPDIHSRFPDTIVSKNDSLSEVRSSSDSVTFSGIDNQKHNTWAKATTDNEVRSSKNQADDKNEEDIWVWTTSTAATTSINTEMSVLQDGGLGDRTSLTGDGCPSGEAKVKGMCVKTHR